MHLMPILFLKGILLLLNLFGSRSRCFCEFAVQFASLVSFKFAFFFSPAFFKPHFCDMHCRFCVCYIHLEFQKMLQVLQQYYSAVHDQPCDCTCQYCENGNCDPDNNTKIFELHNFMRHLLCQPEAVLKVRVENTTTTVGSVLPFSVTFVINLKRKIFCYAQKQNYGQTILTLILV